MGVIDWDLARPGEPLDDRAAAPPVALHRSVHDPRHRRPRRVLPVGPLHPAPLVLVPVPVVDDEVEEPSGEEAGGVVEGPEELGDGALAGDVALDVAGTGNALTRRGVTAVREQMERTGQLDLSGPVQLYEATSMRGEATREAIEASGKRALLLGSNSISHRHFTREPKVPEDMSHEHIYHMGQHLWDMHAIGLARDGRGKQLFDELPDLIDQATSEADAGCLSWLLAALGMPEYPAELHGYGTVIGTGNAVLEWDPNPATRQVTPRLMT